jgi:hypothetical protein
MDTTHQIPIEGAPGYYLVEGRIFSAKTKRFLARQRFGLRWRSVVQTADGRPRYVYLDDPNQSTRIREDYARLLQQNATPIPGFDDYVMLPDLRIFRVKPAQRGPSAGGVYEVEHHQRHGGSPYVQLTNAQGKRSTYSVQKLARATFPQNSVDADPSDP